MGVETKLERERGMGGYHSNLERAAGLGDPGVVGGTSIADWLYANQNDPNFATVEAYQGSPLTAQQVLAFTTGMAPAVNTAVWPDGSVTDSSAIGLQSAPPIQQEITTHEQAAIFAFAVDTAGNPICYIPVAPLEQCQVPLSVSGGASSVDGKPLKFTGTIDPEGGVTLIVTITGDPGSAETITADTMADAIQQATDQQAATGGTAAAQTVGSPSCGVAVAVPTSIASTVSIPPVPVSVMAAQSTLQMPLFGVPVWGWLAGGAALLLLRR